MGKEVIINFILVKNFYSKYSIIKLKININILKMAELVKFAKELAKKNAKPFIPHIITEDISKLN